MPEATVTLKHLHHHDESQIGLYFSYNTSLIEAVKRINKKRSNKNYKYHLGHIFPGQSGLNFIVVLNLPALN